MPVIDSLKRARTRRGSNAALAKILHVTGEQIGRALKGRRGIGAEVALRLAIENDETDQALHLLEEAGHADMAGLLREIFGTPGRDRLTTRQREILELLEAVGADDRAHVVGILKSLAGKKGPKR